MGLFSIITANFAALFIQRKQNKAAKSRWRQNFLQMSELQKEDTEILAKLNEIIERLDQLEQQPPSNNNSPLKQTVNRE